MKTNSLRSSLHLSPLGGKLWTRLQGDERQHGKNEVSNSKRILGEKQQDKKFVKAAYHMFTPNPTLCSSLFFMGLPFGVVPYPLFTLQAHVIGQVLDGKLTLDSEHLQSWVDNHIEKIRGKKITN